MLGFNKLTIGIWKNLKWCIEYSTNTILESFAEMDDFEEGTCNNGYKPCFYYSN